MHRDRTSSLIRERIRGSRILFSQLEYLVKEAGVSRSQGRDLIKRYGDNRSTLLAHARNLLGKSHLSER